MSTNSASFGLMWGQVLRVRGAEDLSTDCAPTPPTGADDAEDEQR